MYCTKCGTAVQEGAGFLPDVRTTDWLASRLPGRKDAMPSAPRWRLRDRGGRSAGCPTAAPPSAHIPPRLGSMAACRRPMRGSGCASVAYLIDSAILGVVFGAIVAI